MQKKKNPVPKTTEELILHLTTNMQQEMETASTAGDVMEAIKAKFSSPLSLPYPPTVTNNYIPIRQGISYDLQQINTGGIKEHLFIKPEMSECESFGLICNRISDRCSATDSDVLAVMTAVASQAVNTLCSGIRFPLYPFGELTLKLKADSLPDNYRGMPKNISIKSVKLIPDKGFLKELQCNAQFQRRQIYSEQVLPPDQRKANILYALSIRPYLTCDEIAGMNNVSRSATCRDLNALLAEKKIYRVKAGIKNAYALAENT